MLHQFIHVSKYVQSGTGRRARTHTHITLHIMHPCKTVENILFASVLTLFFRYLLISNSTLIFKFDTIIKQVLLDAQESRVGV